ncbi:MAG: S8 family serine peptidase [Rickettsiales bacterium]
MMKNESGTQADFRGKFSIMAEKSKKKWLSATAYGVIGMLSAQAAGAQNFYYAKSYAPASRSNAPDPFFYSQAPYNTARYYQGYGDPYGYAPPRAIDFYGNNGFQNVSSPGAQYGPLYNAQGGVIRYGNHPGMPFRVAGAPAPQYPSRFSRQQYAQQNPQYMAGQPRPYNPLPPTEGAFGAGPGYPDAAPVTRPQPVYQNAPTGNMPQAQAGAMGHGQPGNEYDDNGDEKPYDAIGMKTAIIAGVAGAGLIVAALAAGGGSKSSKKSSGGNNNGGGDDNGGGDENSTLHPQSKSASEYQTEEADTNPALEKMHAYDAYGRGYAGQIYDRKANGELKDSSPDGKVKIGILDEQVDFSAVDLAGAITASKARTCTVTGGCVASQQDDSSEDVSHGTVVAHILGARKNDAGTQGVAYESELIPVRFLDVLGGSDIQGTNYLVNSGASVINASYGFLVEGEFDGESRSDISTPIIADSHTDAVFAPEDLRAELIATENGNSNYSYLKVFKKAVDADVAMVFAAGNTPTDNPALLAGLPYYFRGNLTDNKPEGYDVVNPDHYDFSKNWVAVVALDENDQIATYSAHCGVAKEWCLSAPGDYTNTFGSGADGTSFAAPAVSGAVGVLQGAFPHLSTKTVLNILFDTATDLGASGIDDIYGHGMVNLEKATQPSAGGWTLATGAFFNSGGMSVGKSFIQSSAAFGNALQKAGGDVMFLDKYGKNYNISADSLIRAAQNAPQIENSFNEFFEQTDERQYQLRDNMRLTTAERAEGDLPMRGFGGGAAQDRENATAFTLDTQMRLGSRELSFRQSVNNDAEKALLFRNDDAPTAEENMARHSMFGAFRNGFASLAENAQTAATSTKYGNMRLSYGIYNGESHVDDMTRYAERERLDGDAVGGMAARVDFYGKRFGFSGQLGSMQEERGMLGSRYSGAFALDKNTPTDYASFGGNFKATDKLTLSANYNVGMSRANLASAGLMQDIGAVVSDSFSLGAQYEGVTKEGNDRLGFNVSQPLRVRSGSASLRLPEGVNADGTVNYRRENVDLAPSGQETDLEAYYAKAFPHYNGELAFGAGVRLQPDHDASKDADAMALVKYRTKF